ncbi:MAG: MFS transporter, partial [Microcoleaceae cyanobacterium]
EIGIEGVLERVGRSGVEILMEEELMFLGQIYASTADLEVLVLDIALAEAAEIPTELTTNYGELLLRSLRFLETDAIERCFLLMKFLYPLGSIQAASFNIRSESRSSMARGLEILDNTLDISCKRELINILDHKPEAEKLANLGELFVYRQMSPSDRLRHLLELRHFLSDWTLACCFHLARSARWSVSAEQVLVCLRHPTGFVREAVLSYLQVVSQRVLLELLPKLQDDPDPLVAAQVQKITQDFNLASPE